jgi:hypothetical protein
MEQRPVHPIEGVYVNKELRVEDQEAILRHVEDRAVLDAKSPLKNGGEPMSLAEAFGCE